MPAYLYRCLHCRVQEKRLGGPDNHVVVCDCCGHLMLRLDADLGTLYLEHFPHRNKDSDPSD